MELIFFYSQALMTYIRKSPESIFPKNTVSNILVSLFVSSKATNESYDPWNRRNSKNVPSNITPEVEPFMAFLIEEKKDFG